MADAGKWIAVLGGVVAVVGQFWGGPGMTPNIYLPVIGGAIAVIGAFMK